MGTDNRDLLFLRMKEEQPTYNLYYSMEEQLSGERILKKSWGKG